MKKIVFIAFAGVLLASCAKDVDIENAFGREVAFTGSFDDNDVTKTILVDGTAVNWNANDPVSIFDGSSPVQAKADADGATATIKATLTTEGPWYAIYPHDAAATISGDVVTTKILKQTTAKANTFAKKVNVSIARSTDDNKMVFKNTMSYLKFKLSQENIYSVTLKANGGEMITGTVQIDYNDGEPVTTVVSDGSSTSTLLPSTNDQFISTSYSCYIGFVPTTFTEGFTLILTDTFGGSYEVEHSAPFTAERSKVYNAGIIDSEIVLDEAIVFEDADVEAAIVAAFGGGITAGKIYKSEAAAVTFDEFKAFSFTDPSVVNKFNELKYFSGLYANPVPGETRTGYCVPDGFFSGFANLEEITLPSNITEIRPQTFLDCVSLKAIEIPSKVTGIYKKAFSGCTALSGTLSFPEGLKSITDEAFNGCGELTGIVFPSTLTKVGTKTFQNCAKVDELVLPSSLTTIPEYAFYGFLAAKRVVFSDKLTSLGVQAFWRLQSANSVGPAGTPEGHLVVPGGIPSIGQMCFCDEYYLHTMTIKEGPTSIGDRAFRKFGTKVASGTVVTGYVPASVTSITKQAFEESNFDSIHFAGTTPPALTGDIFNKLKKSNMKIYVPASAVDAYKKADFWKDHEARIVAEP